MCLLTHFGRKDLELENLEKILDQGVVDIGFGFQLLQIRAMKCQHFALNLDCHFPFIGNREFLEGEYFGSFILSLSY